MRTSRYYVGDFDSSFLSCEKDAELIIKRLFVDSQPYSDELKRLLIINTKDCLDKDSVCYNNYSNIVDKISIADMVDEGYIRMKPQVTMGENQEVMSYLIITFDNFVTNGSNPHYRDCTIMIDIICHIDTWDIGNYRQRPIKIAGYIDGLLNESKLTGIGTLNFVSCNEVVLTEELAGYCLIYRAVHGDDDLIEGE